MRRRYNRGLTLIELLVAVAVFTIIAAAAYSGLIAVLETREHTDRRADRLAAVQRAVGTLGEDLQQSLPRSVRTDLRGQGHALTDGPDPRDVVYVTRGGWPNPADLDRSTMLRVHWQLEEDGRLVRTWQTRPDAVTGTSTTRRVQLTDVDRVETRFLDADGQWQERWPVDLGAQRSDELPQAVEVTLELDDWGVVERLFALAPDAYAATVTPPAADEAE